LDESVLDTTHKRPMAVVLAIRNQLARYGIESMLRSVDIVSDQRSYDDLDTALAAATEIDGVDEHSSTTLVVALSEVDESAASGLRFMAERGVKILVVVDDVDRRKLSHLAQASGSGFVFADELGAHMLRVTLQRMQGGEMPMPARLTRQLLSAAGAGSGAGAGGEGVRMTPRERHVLTLLVEGLSNKQIARRLGISEHGAKRHVANILAKLNCPNRTLAVAKALRNGLCDPV
jgi:two-component system nitrate/nitrite response regulator NarL